ncbi:MAG TPA: DinB family protein [Acidimicrobiia bacterium]|nr:DinB family protein [Acidimicrobiia bacterium]
MAIEPDTKDWTWVLERPCEECGVDASALDLDALPGSIRALGPAWAAVLERPDVGHRPDDRTWSPLEYACHVRDVLRLYDERLHLMLAQDGPHYPNWDQDAAAVDRRYGDQDPAVVADELAAAADRVAASFAAVAPDQWGRTGFRSDGAAFTVESFARYFLHDPLHHLHDVGAPLPAVTR